jgi:hypothetical protein
MDLKNILTRHLPFLCLTALVCFYLGSRASKPSFEFFRLDSTKQPAPSKELLQVLQNANEDMNLLLAGKSPIHAQTGMKVLDGGSALYENSDYQLWDFRKLNQVNGSLFVKRGVSIRFKGNEPFPGYVADDASYTWLEFANQPGRVSP